MIKVIQFPRISLFQFFTVFTQFFTVFLCFTDFTILKMDLAGNLFDLCYGSSRNFQWGSQDYKYQVKGKLN